MPPSTRPSASERDRGGGNAARQATKPAASSTIVKKKGRRAPSFEAPRPTPPKLAPKTLALRVGVPVAVAWVIAFFIRPWIAYVVVGVLTAAVLGVIGFALYFTRRTQRVASIVGEAKTK